MKAEAVAAAAEAELARGRAVELEQLMRLGQGIARALTTDALRETVWRHLPPLAEGHDAWIVLRTDDGWDRLTDIGFSRWASGEIEERADQVVANSSDVLDRVEGFEARALYQAKADGRDCVRASEDTVTVAVPTIADRRFAELALTH